MALSFRNKIYKEGWFGYSCIYNTPKSYLNKVEVLISVQAAAYHKNKSNYYNAGVYGNTWRVHSIWFAGYKEQKQ